MTRTTKQAFLHQGVSFYDVTRTRNWRASTGVIDTFVTRSQCVLVEHVALSQTSASSVAPTVNGSPRKARWFTRTSSLMRSRSRWTQTSSSPDSGLRSGLNAITRPVKLNRSRALHARALLFPTAPACLTFSATHARTIRETAKSDVQFLRAETSWSNFR